MILIRGALSDDAETAVELLMTSAAMLLVHIFGHGNEPLTRQFLHAAWLAGRGQYGSNNHWVAVAEGDVVGLITCWHSDLPSDFDAATLSSVSSFFGMADALEIVLRSQQYSESLQSPGDDELAIGHLAVSEHHRGKGIGRRLIDTMEAEARARNKRALVLNVEADNANAIAFYQHLGFTISRRVPPFLGMTKTLQSG